MDAVKVRNVILIVLGLYFAINGISSVNIGSALIGLLLAAIAFWVALTGKVHKKFYKKHDPNAGAMTTSDDQALFESVARVKDFVVSKFGKDSVEENTDA